MDTLSISETSLEAAMANTAAAVTNQVSQLNQSLKTNYLAQFNAWAQDVMNGRSDPSTAPKPPLAYVVGSFTDATNPNAHWAYPEPGTQPVCDMPPVPQPAPAYVPPVLPEPDDVCNVPVGDVLPVGYVMTAPDGSRWQKHSSHTPFGIAFYYVRLK
ncbi:MAG: hypothetical protein KGN36_05270 [Acidobacteriota bacterium]|nr:hypothetical protein [Acidobacteriota bacterium]